jgi:protein-S-isoprenylcysteine O-methyltransferase Ste14
MPLDIPTDSPPSRLALDAHGATTRRPFAPPSRAGLLVCAASLMPAYLFGLMGLMNVLGLVAKLQSDPSIDPQGAAAGWLHFGHQALSSSFSVIICALFLIRRPSTPGRGAGGWVADAAAVGGTAVVLGLSMAARTVEDLWLMATAEALLTIGLIIMVIGLANLGRSFGIMPRARGLKQTGMYRFVRHPIYLGEFLAFTGLYVLTFSLTTTLVYIAFIVLQTYRMVKEEQTLSQAYPEYVEYSARTARLLPGVY